MNDNHVHIATVTNCDRLKEFQMSSAMMKARIVRVDREEGKTGLFYATSQDLKGLLVAGSTLDALEQAIPQAIVDLYAACGVQVVVSKADSCLDDDNDQRRWVAFPAEIARQGLLRMGQSPD